MEKRPHSIALAVMAIGLATAGPPRAVAAESHELTPLRVAIVNHAEVPEDVWQRAQTTASRIYEAAGINLLWFDRRSTNTATSKSDLSVIVSAAPLAPGLTSSKHVLGFALQPLHRGRLAYAFYGRIQNFARDTRTDVGVMLGHVIAHEMGHLLLAKKAHSIVGLMRARWEGPQTEMLSTETLTFTNDEAAIIRTRAVGFSARLSEERHPK